MIEKRRYLRIPHRTPVYGTIRFVSELKDISISGCFITNTQALPIGSEIEIEFTLPNTTRIIRAKGEVRWCGRYSSDKRSDLSQGVGLKFTDIALEDISVIMELVKGKSSSRQRRFERYQLSFPIRYALTENDLSLTSAAQDISLGGLFIECAKPFDLNKIIFMAFTLPDIDGEIRCSGKVAYINDNIPDLFTNMIRPGIGVEFIKISDEALEKIKKVVETISTAQKVPRTEK